MSAKTVSLTLESNFFNNLPKVLSETPFSSLRSLKVVPLINSSTNSLQESKSVYFALNSLLKILPKISLTFLSTTICSVSVKPSNVLICLKLF